MIETFRLGDAQPLVKRKDDQGGEALGWRWRVVERAGVEGRAQWLFHCCGIFFQVRAGDRAADAVEVAGDLAPDIAA